MPSSESLPENLRQEYLEALGIDSYFPRFRLPGAPESPQVELPPDTQEEAANVKDVAGGIDRDSTGSMESTEAAEIAAAPEAAMTNTQADSVQAREPAPRQRPAPEVSSSAPDEDAAKEKEEVRFQLVCIRVNDKLAIINAMPHVGPTQLPALHRSLLQNLLRAAGIAQDGLTIEDKTFRWPLVKGEHVDNSRSAAAIALVAYLQQKMADWQFTHLLVMGEQVISRVFTPDGEPGEEEGKDKEKKEKKPPSLTSQAWTTLSTRSLDEILQSPALKKETWSVVRKIGSGGK